MTVARLCLWGRIFYRFQVRAILRPKSQLLGYLNVLQLKHSRIYLSGDTSDSHAWVIVQIMQYCASQNIIRNWRSWPKRLKITLNASNQKTRLKFLKLAKNDGFIGAIAYTVYQLSHIKPHVWFHFKNKTNRNICNRNMLHRLWTNQATFTSIIAIYSRTQSLSLNYVLQGKSKEV